MRRLPAASTRAILAALLSLAIVPWPAPTRADQLTRSSFLSLPQSIRQAGEGGIGLGDGVEAGGGGTNPARLVRLEREIALFAGGGVLHGTDARYFLAGGGTRIGETGALGVALTSAERHIDEIDGQGYRAGRDLTQSAVTIAAFGAWKPAPRLAAGLGLKLVRETVVEEASTVPALDAGVQAILGIFTVGAAIRNLAPALHAEAGGVPSDGYAAEVRLEAAARPWPSLTLGAGYAAVGQRDGRIAAGCEWAPAFARALVLRAGVDGVAPADRNPTAGFSLHLRQFTFDYAFVAHGLGATHLVGLGLAFDRGGPVSAAPAPHKWMAPPAGEIVNVAVADLDAGEGTSAGDAVSVADMLRTALVGLGSLNVVERANMQRILAEQAVQQTGCTRQDCAVKLGRVLNVQRIVVGRFGKFLGAYKVTVQVVDVETSRIVLADEAAGVTREEIEAAIAALARRIGMNLR